VRRDVVQQTDEMLHSLGLSGGEFAVVHMGVGSALREWPREKWREVARALTSSGVPLVLTGAGPGEIRDAEELAHEFACTNLAGRLSWTSFVHVISKARVVIAPETVAGHVAAAVGTPCVSLYTGMGNVDHWRPLSSDCSLLMNEVPCSPCHRRRGCDTMDCIRGITADKVISAAMREHARSRTTSEGLDLISLHRGTA
jgi:ADP-heptose:LPS heptosyltransferase